MWGSVAVSSRDGPMNARQLGSPLGQSVVPRFGAAATKGALHLVQHHERAPSSVLVEGAVALAAFGCLLAWNTLVPVTTQAPSPRQRAGIAARNPPTPHRELTHSKEAKSCCILRFERHRQGPPLTKGSREGPAAGKP